MRDTLPRSSLYWGPIEPQEPEVKRRPLGAYIRRNGIREAVCATWRSVAIHFSMLSVINAALS